MVPEQPGPRALQPGVPLGRDTLLLPGAVSGADLLRTHVSRQGCLGLCREARGGFERLWANCAFEQIPQKKSRAAQFLVVYWFSSHFLFFLPASHSVTSRPPGACQAAAGKRVLMEQGHTNVLGSFGFCFFFLVLLFKFGECCAKRMFYPKILPFQNGSMGLPAMSERGF